MLTCNKSLARLIGNGQGSKRLLRKTSMFLFLLVLLMTISLVDDYVMTATFVSAYHRQSYHFVPLTRRLLERQYIRRC